METKPAWSILEGRHAGQTAYNAYPLHMNSVGPALDVESR
jgi:hypothetical protein